jgi:hypothetical protein
MVPMNPSNADCSSDIHQTIQFHFHLDRISQVEHLHFHTEQCERSVVGRTLKTGFKIWLQAPSLTGSSPHGDSPCPHVQGENYKTLTEVILILSLETITFSLLKVYSFPNKLCYHFHYQKKPHSFYEIQTTSGI